MGNLRGWWESGLFPPSSFAALRPLFPVIPALLPGFLARWIAEVGIAADP